MNKLLLIGMCITLLILVSCTPSYEDCLESDKESKILIYKYKSDHTEEECFEYCDNLCFNNPEPGTSWVDEKCVQLCED